jgi:tRNA(adenine34) deaminase
MTVSEVDLAMMDRALGLAARAAESGEVPVAAVVYRGGDILAEAANQREGDSDPTAHAEMLALRAAGRALGSWRLAECTMAVTLEPCPMCAGAMVNARLGRLLYGTDDPKAGACRTLYSITADERLNHRVAVIPGVMEDRCRGLLQAFFRERRG